MASPGQVNGPPGVSGTNAMAIPQQSQQQQQQNNSFEPMDKSSSSTLKRNPKMELGKSDLLRLLSFLEGELQARDIIIASLKSEKIKHLLNSKYKYGTNDPRTALGRDIAICGGPNNQLDPSDQTLATLEALVIQQKRMQSRMAKILKDAEMRHRLVIKELEEEKQKHEREAAMGDNKSEVLEKENLLLKKELEIEQEERKKFELEAKRAAETLAEEKNRHKQIVLILLAERKKIIMKYIEERKRSEDFSQVSNEDKVKLDQLTEGLEQQTKKAMHMEAELEKNLAQFDIEREQHRQTLAREEKKNQDLQLEIDKIKLEVEGWKDSQGKSSFTRTGATPPPPPAKPANLANMPLIRTGSVTAVLGAGTPMVSSKVVQPTATVSSVPVSGPTTGIARFVTPGQALKNTSLTGSESPIMQETQTMKRIPASGSIGSPKTVQQTGAPVVPGSPATGTIKAVMVVRGAPPPVPPNKPIVPPKKEGTTAAFLRRTESTENAAKFVKQQTVIANPASALLAQNQQTIVATGGATEDEAKPH